MSFNHFRSAKMEKTVVMTYVVLFISSLLLVDSSMVRVPRPPGGILKVFNRTSFSQLLVMHTSSSLCIKYSLRSSLLKYSLNALI